MMMQVSNGFFTGLEGREVYLGYALNIAINRHSRNDSINRDLTDLYTDRESLRMLLPKQMTVMKQGNTKLTVNLR